jgi:choline transport protein
VNRNMAPNRPYQDTLDKETQDIEFDTGSRELMKQWATAYDVHDMDALGLAPTFRRRFKFVAMVGFSSLVVVAWENTLVTFYYALANGGTGGFFWTYVYTIVAMALVYLTISELASWYVAIAIARLLGAEVH